MYEVLDVITSGVSGKTKKGGQSQRRYERLREMHLNDYYKRVAEYANKHFLDRDVVAIVLGGPGPTKETFLKGNYLDYRLQRKVIELIDTGYAGSEGIRDILNRMTEMELFRQNRTLFEKQLVEQFMKGINTDNVVYGPKDVFRSVQTYKAKVVIATDKTDIDFIEEEAVSKDIPIEIISSKTEYGTQFQTFGIGAILR